MATTWTRPGPALGYARVAKAVCTTGTETPVVRTELTDGLDVSALEKVEVVVEMARPTGTLTITSGLAAGELASIGTLDFVARARHGSATATLVSVVAGNKLTVNTVDFVARARYATGTITVASAVAGDEVIVNGVVFTAIASDAATVPAQSWKVGAGGSADTDSGHNLAAAITAAKAICKVTATHALGVVTLTSAHEGTYGNGITLSTPDSTLTLSGATLSGGYDSTANEWPIGTTDAESAAALTAAIGACLDAKIRGVVTAAQGTGGSTNVVTVTAVAEGVSTIAFERTGAPITVSAATLAGGYDASANEWPVGATVAANATALAAAINAATASQVATIARATAANGVVTVEAAPGTAGNSTGLAATGDHIAAGAANLAGGTVIGASAYLRAYLLNPATGIVARAPSLDVTLGQTGSHAALVDVRGVAGRLQYLPDTVGGACTVYLSGVPQSRVSNL